MTVTSSAVKAVVEQVPWTMSEATDDNSGGGVMATPTKSLFDSGAGAGTGAPATPEKSILTPGIKVLHTPGASYDINLQSDTKNRSIKTLNTSLNAEDAARLQHYMVLDKARKRDKGSITRYTKDLRRLCADLVRAQGSVHKIANNYEGLRDFHNRRQQQQQREDKSK